MTNARTWVLVYGLAALVCRAQNQATSPPAYVADERKSYDKIYSSERGSFSTEPNAFLVRTVSGLNPGRALDVAMGQGRNSIWLASQGWSVTGFDISPVAIDEAQREASKRGLKIETLLIPYELFDWGKDKWDLILFSYFFPQSALPKVWDALRPGGLIIVEGFHADTSHIRPIGGGYRDNELLRLLERYRILMYEDVQDRQEWGLQLGATNRLVRVLAQKRGPLSATCSWKGKDYQIGGSMCWGVKWNCGKDGWESGGKCTEQQ